MDRKARIFIAGDSGLVGSALVRRLKASGYFNLLTRTRNELDLEDQSQVAQFFDTEKPDYVFMAAGKVGGISANNNFPADFIFKNIIIQSHLIQESYLHKVKGLLYLASACIYPKLAPQPMSENLLLTAPLEPTNEYYSVAKIAGLKMCQAYNLQFQTNFRSLIGANLYGINDNFCLNDGHVIPALMRRIHEAKLAGQREVVVWGSGAALREFLYVDDFADACIFVMQGDGYKQFMNVGSGYTVSIRDLAHTLKEVTQYSGEIVFDSSKPDGMPIKCLDSSVISRMGWKASTSLKIGLGAVYRWFSSNPKELRS